MKLYNSLANSIQEFKPGSPNKVTIYVCGITPYDTTHLGHAYTYIFFDALIRYLKFKGFDIEYTQNVTDINDRDSDILQKAKEQNITWQKLSGFWTEKFLADMEALNWTPPTHFLYASREIPSMIALIQKLLGKNLAYIVNGSVNLNIKKFPDFGKLSKLSRDDMLKIAHDFEEDLENPNKKDPLDITLWKTSSSNQPSHIPLFNSPWGSGRPGWHIECSAMAISTLGEQIDIHGAGRDLIFPHHEAEIAQSEGSTGKAPFVKYWLHTGTVAYLGKKMSKSKGNLIMVSDLLKKYSPNAIRYLLLSHHFRDDWEYKEEDLKKAQENIDLIGNSCVNLKGCKLNIMQFQQIMDNNLDTPKALELLLQNPDKKIFEILGFKI